MVPLSTPLFCGFAIPAFAFAAFLIQNFQTQKYRLFFKQDATDSRQK